MKNNYSGFLIGFFGLCIYTIYDDYRIHKEHNKQWEEHMAKYPDKYKIEKIQFPK